MRHGLSLVAFVGATSLSSNASADVQHIIGKGHTIEAIANRYGVSAKSIIVANHLKDVRRLKVGDVLTIPKTETPKKAHKDDDKDAKGKDAKGKDKSGKEAKAERSSYAAKPKTPGVIHIRRPATTEELDLRVTQRGGKIAPATLQSIEKIMRAPSGPRHPIEARLVA
ncbi:MAG TPA: LysM domain-containing protein, partial [Labilithrix sp.]|nr:LysM domain-containing protein [Labilithrix sp.]